MNAVVRDVAPAPASKRCCYKCGRRHPLSTMKKKRTPTGGAIYIGPCCAPRGTKAVR